MKQRPDNTWVTFVEVDETEMDPCTVNYDCSPPDPSVNWGGDLDVLSVIHNSVDVYPRMSARERDSLLDRLSDHLRDGCGDVYGDCLYDMRKDDKRCAE